MLPRLTSVAALAASLVLLACGGGSDDPPMPPPPPQATAVPDSAITSASALVGYLSAQSFSDEVSEPLTLPAADPATSETDEPLAL